MNFRAFLVFLSITLCFLFRSPVIQIHTTFLKTMSPRVIFVLGLISSPASFIIMGFITNKSPLDIWTYICWVISTSSLLGLSMKKKSLRIWDICRTRERGKMEKVLTRWLVMIVSNRVPQSWGNSYGVLFLCLSLKSVAFSILIGVKVSFRILDAFLPVFCGWTTHKKYYLQIPFLFLALLVRIFREPPIIGEPPRIQLSPAPNEIVIIGSNANGIGPAASTANGNGPAASKPNVNCEIESVPPEARYGPVGGGYEDFRGEYRVGRPLSNKNSGMSCLKMRSDVRERERDELELMVWRKRGGKYRV